MWQGVAGLALDPHHGHGGAALASVYGGWAATTRLLSPLGVISSSEVRKDALGYAGFIFLYVLWRRQRAGSGGRASAQSQGLIEVRDGARRHFVPLAEVAWIEAAGNYVELHRGQTPILHRAPAGRDGVPAPGGRLPAVTTARAWRGARRSPR